MDSARKILDRYADLLIFVLGIVWVTVVFMRVSQLQTQQYENITGNKNNLVYVETAYDNAVYGRFLISFLLGDDVVPVRYDGTTYSSSERAVLIERIESSSLYTISREYGDADTPVMLIFEKIVEEEGDV